MSKYYQYLSLGGEILRVFGFNACTFLSFHNDHVLNYTWMKEIQVLSFPCKTKAQL